MQLFLYRTNTHFNKSLSLTQHYHHNPHVCCVSIPLAHGTSPSPTRFGDDIPGMEGLGTDITVVCPWEAFGDMELGDLAKYGIV